MSVLVAALSVRSCGRLAGLERGRRRLAGRVPGRGTRAHAARPLSTCRPSLPCLPSRSGSPLFCTWSGVVRV